MLASEKKEAELESFAEMIRGSATEDICMLLKKYMTQLYQENEEKLPDFVAQGQADDRGYFYGGHYGEQYCG